jgi:DNA replication licensing factor MCM2
MVKIWKRTQKGKRFVLTIIRDYQAVPELDRYEKKGMDEEDYDHMEDDERRDAERDLDLRDRAR